MIFIEVALKAASETALQGFLPTIRAAMEGTHKEKGSLIYRFTVDLDDPCVLRVTELWESEEALFAHFEGEPVKLTMEIIPELQVLSMQAYQGDLVPYEVPLPAELRS
ncbi:putative quinol monooxygenase [Streptomyces blattellae]|uniref:putative quinol monooxygenase n=1 Tax=Streptomyces blattellae TaxID=2569855 RepID=UPI0012B8E2C0|nr:antibiotic biosynthesis monooxygenase [Streptomyces blattellae]